MANIVFAAYAPATILGCRYSVEAKAIGDCNYYIERFKNFMERHPSCAHNPPVYYFGEMREIGKLSHGEKMFIMLTTVPTRISITGQTDASRAIQEAETRKLEEDRRSPYQYTRRAVTKVPSPDQSYGYKYCSKFTSELMPKLTVAGKAWLRQARYDLQVYMEQGAVNLYYISKYNTSYNKLNGFHSTNGAVNREKVSLHYTNIELNNTKFQSFVFATHPDAYNPQKMSSLPVHDLIRILLTPDMKEWLGAETWEQAWIMARNMDYGSISKSSWEQLKTDTKSVIDGAKRTLSKAKDSLSTYWDEIFK